MFNYKIMYFIESGYLYNVLVLETICKLKIIMIMINFNESIFVT